MYIKNLLTIGALLLALPVSGLAGSEYDRCIKEEKILKDREAGDCSGLSYLFNPSGCFATRKALREYTPGKCRDIGKAEHVEFSIQAPVSEKKRGATSRVITAATPVNDTADRVETEMVPQLISLEQLQDENARLKSEVKRLKSENEQLKKQLTKSDTHP